MKMLDTVRLTDTQKTVICKIIAAPTPKVAAEDITGSANLAKAKDILMDLGLIKVSLEDHAELTDTGRQLAQEENLADQSGNLTPDGEKYAYADSTDNNGQSPETPPAAADDGMAPPPPNDMLTMSASTSGTLLAELLRGVNLDTRR
jgi:hypothetical protein